MHCVYNKDVIASYFSKLMMNTILFLYLIVCAAKESVWICVTCGQLNCGRYVKAHALSHYDKAPDGNGHPVCLECNELSVFW